MLCTNGLVSDCFTSCPGRKDGVGVGWWGEGVIGENNAVFNVSFNEKAFV